jgi:type IV secretory pathway TrbD component
MKPADYAIPVHRSLQEPDVIMGIGFTALLLIVSVTVILASLVSIWCVLLGAAALVIVKILCKDDPFLVDILIDNLSQPDRYEG